MRELIEPEAKQQELLDTISRLEQKIDLLLSQQKSEATPAKELLDVVDVAELCMVSQRCVYRWASNGKIPACKLNGRLLFRQQDIQTFIAQDKSQCKTM